MYIYIYIYTSEILPVTCTKLFSVVVTVSVLFSVLLFTRNPRLSIGLKIGDFFSGIQCPN